MDQLSGMFAIQFAPYEAGKGEIIWQKNKHGIEIPLITCSYTIWARNYKYAGTPAGIAAKLNIDSKNRWVMTHAWSRFKKIDSNDINAENTLEYKNAKSGVSPTGWCVDRLNKQVNAVSPEELIWRIRMKQSPLETKKILEAMGEK